MLAFHASISSYSRSLNESGGHGRRRGRLRPLTLARPKPMLPVVNRPVLGHILCLLKRHGLTDVVITLQYITARIGLLWRWHFLGHEYQSVIEESPLNTGDAQKRRTPTGP